MGLFNAMASVNKINSLLKDFENQVTITQGLVERNAPAWPTYKQPECNEINSSAADRQFQQ